MDDSLRETPKAWKWEPSMTLERESLLHQREMKQESDERMALNQALQDPPKGHWVLPMFLFAVLLGDCLPFL